MKAVLLSIAAAFLLTLSAANAGQIWAATGSTGTIDPAVISIAGIGTSSVNYSSSSTSTTPITVRYNVTSDDTTAPTWSTLEILANNQNVTNAVFASLYKVNRSNGTVTLIASVGSTASPSAQATAAGLGVVTFDFTTNYYVVAATLTRASSSVFPTLQGVRLY